MESLKTNNGCSLEEYKKEICSKYKNCHVLEHPLDGEFFMSAGMLEGKSLLEKVVTNGSISLKETKNSPRQIFWQNHLVTLKNGTSVKLEITNATFLIDIIRLHGQEEISIHIEEPDQQLLKLLVEYLYHHHFGGFKENKVEFTSPTILEIQNRLDTFKLLEHVNLRKGTHVMVKSIIGQTKFSQE